MNKCYLLSFLFLFFVGCKFFEQKRLFSKDDEIIDYAKEIKDTSTVASDLAESIADDESSQYSDGSIFASDNSDDKVHIIVGSFLIPQNAEYYNQKLHEKGYSSKIITDEFGFNMVSVQSFSTIEEGYRELNRYKQEFNSKAWIYSQN